MKKTIYIILFAMLSFGTASAQDTFYSLFTYSYEIPKVTINDQAYDLQKSLFPKMYKNRSINTDIKWVQENDSLLTSFWEIQGDTILHILTELSGIEWNEKELNLYLLRYYSQIGSADPLILPLGGIHNGSYIEAAQDIQKQKLLLIYHLAKRMLMQTDRSEIPEELALSYHPLMRKTPYRFDNLAMLLALTTSYSILGVDTTYDITQSKFWKNKFRGRKIFEEYFERDWILTPEQTLADWITSEPTRSRLVTVTRTPRMKKDIYSKKRTFVEDLPLKGKFGFAVKLNDAGHTAVTEIDEYRLAYACGLRTDDVIRRIDGRLVRSHKQIIEYLIDRFNDGGSVVGINRMGQSMEIIIQPLEIDYLEDEYYLDEYNQDDTMYFDTIPPATPEIE